MFVGDFVQAIIVYPIILLGPGLLWTFLFKSISSRMGIIKRLLVSAIISISIMPLLIFSMNRFLDIQVNILSVSMILLLIALLPLLISFVFAYFIPNFQDFIEKYPTFDEYAELPNDENANAVFVYNLGIIPQHRNASNEIGRA